MMVSIDLNKVFKFLVMAFVCVGTLFYVPISKHGSFTDAVNFGYTSQEMYFRYGAFFLFAFSCFLTPKRRVNLGWYASLFIYFLLLALIMTFDIKMRSSLTNIGLGILFIKTLSEHMDSSVIKTAGKWFIGLLVLNMVMGTLQYFGHDPLFTPDPNLGQWDRVVGFMRIKVHLGVLAAICAPFIYSVHPLFLLVCIPPLISSVSSVAVAGFAVSVLFISFFELSRKKFFILILAILVSAGAFIFKYDMPGGQFHHRFQVWEKTVSFSMKTNPVLGVGVGSFSKWSPTTSQETTDDKLVWSWAHNEYLQACFEGGLFVLFVILGYISGVFKAMKKNLMDRESRIAFASLLSVFAVSFFHFPFHIARLAIPCLFVMAVFEMRAAECR